MEAVLIVGIVFGSIVAIFAIIFGHIFGQKRGAAQLNADETRLIQELHQGLARMEERVEALETILFDREMKGERKEGKK